MLWPANSATWTGVLTAPTCAGVQHEHLPLSEDLIRPYDRRHGRA